jgi:predicted metal-dependent HD superfamily phosphohydrolase
VGYVEGRLGHEKRSAQIATEYLKNGGIEPDIIERVVDCILATEVPQKPSSELAQILCDADLSGLGAMDYELRSENLRIERERMDGNNFPVQDWLRSEMHFYESHEYFTPAAKSLFGPQKSANYLMLKERSTP